MSTKAGIQRVKNMVGDGWVYAGGVGQGTTDFQRHEDYHEAFCRDWKCGVCPDQPDIPGAVGKRDHPYSWHDNDIELTNCVCGETIKNVIFVYHPKLKEWEWLGSKCRQFVEEEKLCGGCKKNYHRNTKKVKGMYENRCDECRALAKENKKKKKVKRCECGNIIKNPASWCKQCYQCYSRQNEFLND